MFPYRSAIEAKFTALDLKSTDEAGEFEHRPTRAEPLLLGFECHAALSERLGAYDYYAYLEDDLIVRDPWFFVKLAWFTGHVGEEALLQPNRYEFSADGPIPKAYIDGDIVERATVAFQNVAEVPRVLGEALGVRVEFRRALNPHSGAFFLTAGQMAHWVRQPTFLDRDVRFIGPLESAASLGVMRTFRVYKPAPENANFLEIEHFGTGFLRQIRMPQSSSASGSG